MEPIRLQDLPALHNSYELKRFGIVRVPQVVYQAMYDLAAADNYSRQSKYKVLMLIEEWIRDTYPDCYIVASVELSAKEAIDLQLKFPGIEFGVYVRLKRRNVDTKRYDPSPTDILDMIVYRDSWDSIQE